MFSGIIQPNDRIHRESRLLGPYGGAPKLESIWENNKLITLKLLGGRKYETDSWEYVFEKF